MHTRATQTCNSVEGWCSRHTWVRVPHCYHPSVAIGFGLELRSDLKRLGRFLLFWSRVMIPGAPENKRAHYTRIPISPIHARYKLGYSQPWLSCDCGAQLDLNKV